MIPILGRIGLRTVDPDFATVVRGVVAALVLIGLGSAARVWSAAPSLRDGGSRALVFIGLTGVAGAFSWWFYFRALQAATVARGVPLDKLSVPLSIVLAVLLLGERPSAVNWVGITLVVAGSVLATLPAK